MKKIDLLSIKQFKKSKKKITALTCYDAAFSNAISEAKIDIILVGDSLGNTIQGHESTIPVDIEDMVYHTKNVVNGNSHCYIIADMPFMSYFDINQAMYNAKKLIQAGANMIKLEGDCSLAPFIEKLTKNGIPVCAHIGLNPQHVNIYGYRTQGKSDDSKQALKSTALELEKSGAQMIVIECVPESLASEITESVNVPTIGIGAGAKTDGQILVLYDILGLFGKYRKKSYKFSKVFLNKENPEISLAIESYKKSVENGNFPSKEHWF